MIQFDASYNMVEHSNNYLTFYPNYYSMLERSEGAVLFFHSPQIVESCVIRSLAEATDIFGPKPPNLNGFFALYSALLCGVPALQIVTVPIGTPLSDAMWKLADDPDYEHAKYLQECLASIFPR